MEISKRPPIRRIMQKKSTRKRKTGDFNQKYSVKKYVGKA